MYGLVNKAVEDLVLSKFGEDTWETILDKADIEEDYFVAMQSYSDDVTYKLVGAASEVLDMPAEQVLEVFGEYWILYTAEKGYGSMLDMAGSSLDEFLKNLNNLHSQVAVTLPELKPPSFKIDNVEEKIWRVHYHSDRAGLTSMMVGLLKGLAQRFGQEGEVVVEAINGEGSDHDVYLLTVH